MQYVILMAAYVGLHLIQIISYLNYNSPCSGYPGCHPHGRWCCQPVCYYENLTLKLFRRQAGWMLPHTGSRTVAMPMQGSRCCRQPMHYLVGEMLSSCLVGLSTAINSTPSLTMLLFMTFVRSFCLTRGGHCSKHLKIDDKYISINVQYRGHFFLEQNTFNINHV